MPELFSVIVFITLVITLRYQYCNENQFPHNIASVRGDVMTISGVICSIVITYITTKALQIRNEKLELKTKWYELTQKTHKFRSIILHLIHSNIWKSGLKNSIKQQYNGLTFYDIYEQRLENSKVNILASQFIQDNSLGETKYLFLALNEFKLSDYPPDPTLEPEYEIPDFYYTTELLKSWTESRPHEKLLYFFYDGWELYRFDLMLDQLSSQTRNSILSSCNYIDKEKYKGRIVDNELLEEITRQFSKDILPKLYALQSNLEQKLPRTIKYLLFISLGLGIFGIILPLLTKSYNLSILFDSTSFAVTLTILSYVFLSINKYLSRELNVI